MVLYTIYNKHIYITLKNVVTVTPPQVAIATTHGAASDDKSRQTDDP